MRIDMVQPAPVPSLPKVSESSETSTRYERDLNRDMRKNGKEGQDRHGDSHLKGVSQEEIDNVNEQMQKSGSKIQYRINHDSHEVIIQVVDKQTNKVLEEIPPEKFQKIAGAAAKTAEHSRIDKKV